MPGYEGTDGSMKPFWQTSGFITTRNLVLSFSLSSARVYSWETETCEQSAWTGRYVPIVVVGMAGVRWPHHLQLLLEA